jgi:hypothetical protein
MNPDLTALRDIHDPLGNPWWPLAPGWWLLLLALVGLVALIWQRRRRWPVIPPLPLLRIGDWRWDAYRQLRHLRRPLTPGALKTRTAELSELLRRIAMARHGRSACAGLFGTAWLDWLTEHDPDGFDWRAHGPLLIRAPYAPEPRDADAATGLSAQQQLERLFAATERWISERPRQPRRRARQRLRWPRRPGAGGEARVTAARAKGVEPSR